VDPNTIPDRSTERLYHELVTRVNSGIAIAAMSGYPFAIFEGYRSPERQAYLYDQGRDRPGRIVTRAKAWESAHQAGVAIDLAYRHDGGKWSWDFTPGDVKRFFAPLGFEFLDWEAPHLQITAGLGGKAVAAMAKEHGIPYVWAEITKRLKEKNHGANPRT
jgi:peptidoglycan L-alanyl-D-glutamate endopeptidase CwlK